MGEGDKIMKQLYQHNMEMIINIHSLIKVEYIRTYIFNSTIFSLLLWCYNKQFFETNDDCECVLNNTKILVHTYFVNPKKYRYNDLLIFLIHTYLLTFGHF